jgi:hypothetical protein
MTPEFQQLLDRRLGDYRRWADGRSFSSARLVQYCGYDEPATLDIELSEVEDQITGLICEGYRVDWNIRGERMFLLVWESREEPPPWNEVFRA